MVNWPEYTVEMARTLGVEPQHVCECGAGGLLHTALLIKQGARADLIEPHPHFFAELYRDYPAQCLWDCAIADPQNPNVPLTLLTAETPDGSSYIEGVDAPRTRFTPYTKHITVLSVLFSKIDDGTIDWLMLDMEGCEWWALQEMKSRPKVIVIEWKSCKGWRQPNAQEIEGWMRTNGYTLHEENKNDRIYTCLS